jgi:predicted TPR repeat methyltransferase
MALLSNKLTRWRHAMIRSYVHGEVLDLGCGDAVILSTFGDAITQYCGIEWSETLIAGVLSRFPDAVMHRRNLDKEPLDLDIIL